jgi:hypothetical protein
LARDARSRTRSPFARGLVLDRGDFETLVCKYCHRVMF